MTAEGARQALDQCARIEENAARLRDGFALPDDMEDPDKVLAALRDIRGRLDAAEKLLREVRRFRRHWQSRARLAAYKRDDEYDKRLARLAEGAVRREFEGAREREAQARLDVIELTREQRAAEAVRDRAGDAYELVRDAYFGLTHIRGELLALIDSFLPWLRSLEHG